jgi:hypothetical protein
VTLFAEFIRRHGWKSKEEKDGNPTYSQTHINRSNFKDTLIFTGGARGASLHNLENLLKNAHIDTSLMTAADHSGNVYEAWKTVVKLWDKDTLRYGSKVGWESDSKRFIEAVKVLHDFILERLERQRRKS